MRSGRWLVAPARVPAFGWLSWLPATALALGLFAPAAIAAAPSSAPYCPPWQQPAFALGFATLKAQVGAAMGDAVECEHAQAGGGTLQRTTTGLAVYDGAANTPTFTDGHQHWALTTDGLVTWSAGWHAGFLPAGAGPAPAGSDGLQPTAPLASLEAAQLAAASDGVGPTLVIERGAQAYRLAVGDGCPDAGAAVGREVFIRTDGPGGASAAVILLDSSHQECPILAAAPEAAP